MAIAEESFVISFGDVLVSPYSISFSHTFFDGLRLLSGMRGGDAFWLRAQLLGQRCGPKGRCRRSAIPKTNRNSY
jgi:hypothetical protein